MFDLIKHLVKNDIKHTVSGNGNITVTCNLDLKYVDGVDAAEAYKKAGRDCVAELAEKLNRRE
ncbi:hypothetical protein RCM47_16420 [Escherichia coli]|nr:hypothetical protein [Escherichia coli]